jgi:hypothetical protein
LDWIASPDPSCPADTPFVAVQNDATWNKYSKWWKKFLVYLYDLDTILDHDTIELNPEETILCDLLRS